MAITHNFVNPRADGPDATRTRASNWNADHDIDAATITAAMLDRVYVEPAELDAYQLTSAISSAAFRTSSYFALSSIVETHVAETDPHTQYQLAAAVSSAAFTASSLYAISTHLHSASDINSSTFAVERLGSGVAASSNFLRGDRSWAVPAAGAVAWGEITGNVSSQTDLGSVVSTESANWALSSVVTVHVAQADPHTQYQMVSSLSTAAFRTSTYFAISSVVTTHIAQSNPHTQYQLSSAVSSAAFTVSSLYAISTHALRHITGGADQITTFNATSSGVVPASGGGTTNFLRADGTFAAPSGGSDPWTYLVVSAAHFSVSNIAVRSITGLSFVPGASSSYEFEGCFALRTGSTSIMPRIGITWPTGTSTGVGWINAASTATGILQAYGSTLTTHVRINGASLPNSTQPWPAILGGFFNMGGSPGSTFSISLASETSSTIFVSTLIGSYLKYRIRG